MLNVDQIIEDPGRALDKIDVLETACRAALDWINRFGEHAPIMFGGEADLAEQLSAALDGSITTANNEARLRAGLRQMRQWLTIGYISADDLASDIAAEIDGLLSE